MNTITRIIVTGVVTGALTFSGVAVATAAEATTSKNNTTNTSVVKADSGKKEKGKKKKKKNKPSSTVSQAAVSLAADGFPDLSNDNLKTYKMDGVSLEVIPVDPNSQVITQDYFVIAKGFTGPVKVRVDGWELSLTAFDLKYHPEHYDMAEAAAQEFVIPGNGKHRITVTHPYIQLCKMIHAKAGDQKGRTAGAQFEANAFYESEWQQQDAEEADASGSNSHRPTVNPAKPPKK